MKKKYYVALNYKAVFKPAIIEEFDDRADAETYAALMSRTQKRDYIVLEIASEWNGSSEK